MSAESSETIEIQPQQVVETNNHRYQRFREIGRTVLASATGLSIAWAFSYVGYRFGGPLFETLSAEDRRGGAYGAGTGIGFMLGATTGLVTFALIEGDHRLNNKKSRSSKAESNPVPTKTAEVKTETPAVAESQVTPEAVPAPEVPEVVVETPQLTLDELAQAVNEGTLSKEIDAANGNDPELAV